MSKLVYKSINEIINKKFISERESENSTAQMQRKKLEQQVSNDRVQGINNLKKANDTRTQINTLDAKRLKATNDNLESELRKEREKDRKRDRETTDSKDNAQLQLNNFDAQAVPGTPPVGMPPTAAPTPPPAPMPKPAAPNYEGGHMTKTQLCQAHEACSNMMASIEDYDSLPDWLKGKITLAADYLVKCESFVNAKDQEHEDSQGEHMPKAPTPPAPAPSPMKPSTGGGTPMMGISLGRVQSVSPGE